MRQIILVSVFACAVALVSSFGASADTTGDTTTTSSNGDTPAQTNASAASWQRVNDPYAPYYGGLQMDIGFQRAYGARLLVRKGTADHWTPLEQMWVAERALRA